MALRELGWAVAASALPGAGEARAALSGAGSPLQMAARAGSRLPWPACVALFALVGAQ